MEQWQTYCQVIFSYHMSAMPQLTNKSRQFLHIKTDKEIRPFISIAVRIVGRVHLHPQINVLFYHFFPGDNWVHIAVLHRLYKEAVLAARS